MNDPTVNLGTSCSTVQLIYAVPVQSQATRPILSDKVVLFIYKQTIRSSTRVTQFARFAQSFCVDFSLKCLTSSISAPFLFSFFLCLIFFASSVFSYFVTFHIVVSPSSARVPIFCKAVQINYVYTIIFPQL